MKRVSREERARQIEECEASGMTVREWCAANGVPLATIQWWRRRLREERERDLAPAFVEVAAGEEFFCAIRINAPPSQNQARRRASYDCTYEPSPR